MLGDDIKIVFHLMHGYAKALLMGRVIPRAIEML